MALWGISTTTETAANNYAIPKHLSENDRNNTPWNCFADMRGWVYRRYHSTDHSGLSTDYYDEVLVPVTGLNTAGVYGSTDLGATGIGTGGPVAVFFENPNQTSRISVGGGGTTGVTTGANAYVHVVFNELVFAGAGATLSIRSFDANNANENSRIVAYATTAAGATQYAWSGLAANNNGSPNVFVNYNGQITNRVAFAFTSPSSVLSANVNFLTTATTTGQTVGAGGTVIWVDSITNVSVGSSITITGKLTNAPVVSIGDTFVRISSASTIGSTIAAGVAATFSTRTNQTILKIDMDRGFVGVVTDAANGVGVISAFTGFGVDLLRNVGGAGTAFSGVGIGTTTLTVTA